MEGPTEFSRWLRSEIKKRDQPHDRYGVRTLARQIVESRTHEGYRGDVETVRRTLNKYLLDGVNPSPAMREEIGRVLGVSVEEMPEEEEDVSPELIRFAKAARDLLRSESIA
jgi:transcriptional regulator with XRE-family HTH domain